MNATNQQRIERRFLDSFSVDTETGCWIWLKQKNNKGYGYFSVYGKYWRAHKFSFESFYHKVPSGLTLDHVCKQKDCVNPTHLRIVTNAENMAMGNCVSAVNARKTHCINGHPFSTDTTRIRDNKGRDRRDCLICEKFRNDIRKVN